MKPLDDPKEELSRAVSSLQVHANKHICARTQNSISSSCLIYTYAYFPAPFVSSRFVCVQCVYVRASMLTEQRQTDQQTDMGWLRLVGSLKLLVSFAKEPYKRDYILQKRPIILRSLLIVATPYPARQRDKTTER